MASNVRRAASLDSRRPSPASTPLLELLRLVHLRRERETAQLLEYLEIGARSRRDRRLDSTPLNDATNGQYFEYCFERREEPGFTDNAGLARASRVAASSVRVTRQVRSVMDGVDPCRASRRAGRARALPRACALSHSLHVAPLLLGDASDDVACRGRRQRRARGRSASSYGKTGARNASQASTKNDVSGSSSTLGLARG